MCTSFLAAINPKVVWSLPTNWVWSIKSVLPRKQKILDETLIGVGEGYNELTVSFSHFQKCNMNHGTAMTVPAVAVALAICMPDQYFSPQYYPHELTENDGDVQESEDYTIVMELFRSSILLISKASCMWYGTDDNAAHHPI